MKTGHCQCGNRVFFSNYQCLACESQLGRCNVCRALTSFMPKGEQLECSACGVASWPCRNRSFSACNCFVEVENGLCQWCQLTAVVPDLSDPKNVRRWSDLERAKRRLLLELAELKLPPYVGNVAETHPLSFQFMGDETDENGQKQTVYTGHANGVITINILEADSVHRESTRVALGEPQRTLIGHMRHEVGHYIDWCYASRVASQEYQQLFGDPAAVDYETAKQQHYANGAPADWAEQFVSAYAAMHPWEDFAETVNVYLDLLAIGVTANDQKFRRVDISPAAKASDLVNTVLEISIVVSEFNLDLGLLPLLPERLSPAVIEKLSFVHNLRSQKMLSRLSELALTAQ